MAERVDLKIVRVSIENEDEPCRVSINSRGGFSGSTALHCPASSSPQKSAFPPHLVIGPTEKKPESPDTLRAEEIEQIIVEGLAAMQHSGQIAPRPHPPFSGSCPGGGRLGNVHPLSPVGERLHSHCRPAITTLEVS